MALGDMHFDIGAWEFGALSSHSPRSGRPHLDIRWATSSPHLTLIYFSLLSFVAYKLTLPL
jgi:hypothetical protein